MLKHVSLDNYRFQWIAIIILLLAAGLRFYRLDAQSFWNDEGNSARLSERPIPLIIEGTASDIHPPLYYLLLHGWRGLVGDSEFSLRAFSVLVGVGIVAVTCALGTAIGGRWLAVTGAGLTAVSPALVYYSQETRMYALLAFEAILATWCLVRWLNSGQGNRQGFAVGYVCVVAAGLYTHYFFPAVLLSHGCIILFHQQPSVAITRLPIHPFICSFVRLLGQWLSLTAVSFLLYLPWLPVFIRQAGGRPANRAPFWEFLQGSGHWLAFGHTINSTDVLGSSLAVIGLLVMGTAVHRRALILLFAALMPVLFMYAVGTTQPEFFKFMLVAVPPFCLLLAQPLTIDHSSRLPIRHFFFLILLLVVVVGNGRSLQHLYFDPFYARADYREMATRIATENHPNAGIILDAPNQWEVFTYYHREGAPVYPLPRSQPDPTLIEAELSQIVTQHDRIYAIFWGETQRDPERLVERWLDTHAFKATDEWVGDVRFVTYAVPQQAATEMQTAVSLPFGDSITLNGYTLLSDRLQPGDIVQVTLFWETAEPLSQRYKVFLHLVDENGQLVAQRDSEPGGGLALTTTWQPGQVVADNHGVLIPGDVANGRYALLLGLYDLADPMARLPIQTTNGPIDAFSLAVITVHRTQ